MVMLWRPGPWDWQAMHQHAVTQAGSQECPLAFYGLQHTLSLLHTTMLEASEEIWVGEFIERFSWYAVSMLQQAVKPGRSARKFIATFP
jgi:hypothetical protein